MSEEATFTVFVGQRKLISAPLREMLTALKNHWDAASKPLTALPLVFDDRTGNQKEFNLQGTLEEVLARAEPRPMPTKPGRPKLGVVAREVTLLPRHWDWLASHPNGASATLRRLIDEARKADPAGERQRLALMATDRFILVMAGDQVGAEEAGRALYAGDQAKFAELMKDWPQDIREHLELISVDAFRGKSIEK